MNVEWCEQLIDYVFGSRPISELYEFYKDLPPNLSKEDFHKKLRDWGVMMRPRLVRMCKAYIFERMGRVDLIEALRKEIEDENRKRNEIHGEKSS